jgi:hypothetical protein
MKNLRVRLDAVARTKGELKLLTIDVATEDAATTTLMFDKVSRTFVPGTIARDIDTTFVRIGLGSQLITMDSMTADVRLGEDKTTLDTAGSMLGKIAMYGLSVRVEGTSYVDISAHGGSGVTLDLAVRINEIKMVSCAWGDDDGMGPDSIVMNLGIGDAAAGHPSASQLIDGDVTSTGYIGLKDMKIVNLTVAGQVMIDVATLDGSGGADTIAMIYKNEIQVYGPAGQGNTAVIIRLNNLQIGMDSFEADVALSATGDLGGAGAVVDAVNSQMGSIYIKNMDVNVDGWVAIFAH